MSLLAMLLVASPILPRVAFAQKAGDKAIDRAREKADARVGWFGASIELDNRGRIAVAEVTTDTQASRAGMLPGDVILSVEGHAPSTLTGLIDFTSKLISTRKAGDEIAVKVARGEREQTLLLPVGEASTVNPLPATTTGAGRNPAVLGIAVKERGPYVVVTQVINNEPAAAAGIRPEDVILGVGNQKISSYATLAAAIKPLRPGDRVPVQVMRDKKSGVVNITVGTRKSATADVVLDQSEDIVEIVAEVKKLKAQVSELTAVVNELTREVSALKKR